MVAVLPIVRCFHCLCNSQARPAHQDLALPQTNANKVSVHFNYILMKVGLPSIELLKHSTKSFIFHWRTKVLSILVCHFKSNCKLPPRIYLHHFISKQTRNMLEPWFSHLVAMHCKVMSHLWLLVLQPHLTRQLQIGCAHVISYSARVSVWYIL